MAAIYVPDPQPSSKVIASEVLLRTNLSIVASENGYQTWIYYQKNDGTISVTYRSADINVEADWQAGDGSTILESGKAMLHTPLVTTMWSQQDQLEFRTYYLDTAFQVRELVTEQPRDNGKWSAGLLDNLGVHAAPYSQLGAFSWRSSGLPHIRVYYQGLDDKIHELCYDGHQWVHGATLPGSPLHGTSLSFVNRSTSHKTSIRGYYQASNLHLQEVSYDSGWSARAHITTFPVPFRTAISANVPRSAEDGVLRVHWIGSDNRVQELWKKSADGGSWNGPGAWSGASGFDGGKVATISFYRGDTDDADLRMFVQTPYGMIDQAKLVKGDWHKQEALKGNGIKTIPIA